MKKLFLLIAMTLSAAPPVGRASLEAVEKAVNRRIETLFDDPSILLGFGRAVYLESYGTVVTAEVNLAITGGFSPFRMTISDAEKAALRKKKLDRLGALRKAMKEMLLGSAKALDTMPADEQVVVGISLLNRSFEDTTGLPAQIVMQAPKRALLAATVPDAAIKVREF